MSFFDKIKKTIGLGKEETLPELTTIDNLKEGGTINFPMMFEPQTLVEVIEKHNRNFQITKKGVFNFREHSKNRVWAELDHGSLYLAKRGNKAEVIKPIEDIEAFLECVDMETFRPLLELDENEVQQNSRGEQEIVSDDKLIDITSEYSMLKAQEFLVQQDLLKTTCNLYDVDMRFIEAKNLNGSNYIYVFILMNGETMLFESTLMDLHELDFI